MDLPLGPAHKEIEPGFATEGENKLGAMDFSLYTAFR